MNKALVAFAVLMAVTGMKVCMLVGVDPRANPIVGYLFLGGGIGLLVTELKGES